MKATPADLDGKKRKFGATKVQLDPETKDIKNVRNLF